MYAEITAVHQELSLTDGTTKHRVVLTLPDGVSFVAEVTQATLALLTQRFVASDTPASRAAVAASAQEEPAVSSASRAIRPPQPVPQPAEELARDYSPMALSEDDEGNLVFGGDGGGTLQPTEDPGDYVETEQEEAPVAVPLPPRVQSKRRPVVTRDEAGNPVLRGPNHVSTESILGGTGIEAGDTGQL